MRVFGTEVVHVGELAEMGDSCLTTGDRDQGNVSGLVVRVSVTIVSLCEYLFLSDCSNCFSLTRTRIRSMLTLIGARERITMDPHNRLQK